MNNFLKSRAMVFALALICLLAVPAACIASSSSPLETLGNITMTIGVLGGVAAYNFGDGNLAVTKTLPNGAANVTSTSLDTGESSTGSNTTPYEFLLEVPALTTGILGDAATIIYDVVTSASADLSGPTTVAKAILTQTGAGGAGAAANSVRFRLPTNAQRYVGIKATKSASGDASALSMTLSMKF